jgi:hypothetical protein
LREVCALEKAVKKFQSLGQDIRFTHVAYANITLELRAEGDIAWDKHDPSALKELLTEGIGIDELAVSFDPDKCRGPGQRFRPLAVIRMFVDESLQDPDVLTGQFKVAV